MPKESNLVNDTTAQSDTRRSSEWLRCKEGVIGRYRLRKKGVVDLNIVCKRKNETIKHKRDRLNP